eukprot:TRINITY_DN17122_c0_g1_i2.p1 TRINITY_DN17122_c0_g1~~TRINITY_DN17122_c0_g1_i2.p1  ORF type:complete len:561 (-),score=94.44 TRINITY_DN17122_c0_g1_i2:584-2266(-)
MLAGHGKTWINDTAMHFAKRLQEERESSKEEAAAIAQSLAKMAARDQEIGAELSACLAKKAAAEKDISDAEQRLQSTRESRVRLEQQQAVAAIAIVHKESQVSLVLQCQHFLDQQTVLLQKQQEENTECQRETLKAKQDVAEAQHVATRAKLENDQLRCSLEEVQAARDREAEKVARLSRGLDEAMAIRNKQADELNILRRSLDEAKTAHDNAVRELRHSLEESHRKEAARAVYLRRDPQPCTDVDAQYTLAQNSRHLAVPIATDATHCHVVPPCVQDNREGKAAKARHPSVQLSNISGAAETSGRPKKRVREHDQPVDAEIFSGTRSSEGGATSSIKSSVTASIAELPSSTTEGMNRAPTRPAEAQGDALETVDKLDGEMQTSKTTIAAAVCSASATAKAPTGPEDTKGREVETNHSQRQTKSVTDTGIMCKSDYNVFADASAPAKRHFNSPQAPPTPWKSTPVHPLVKPQRSRVGTERLQNTCRDCGQQKVTFVDASDDMAYCQQCWVAFYGELPRSPVDAVPLAALPVKCKSDNRFQCHKCSSTFTRASSVRFHQLC